MFFVNTLKNFKLSLKSKTHDLQNLENGVDYFLDFMRDGQVATLTTTVYVKVGETVILNYDNKPEKYYVDAIDSYWNSDLIQTVLLKKSNHVNG